VLERGNPVRERRQLLSELVVHLSRNATPLVFLREDQPSQELRARALSFRPPALGQVEVRSDDARHGSAWLAADGESP